MLTAFLRLYYIWCVAKKIPTQYKVKTWRPTAEDEKLVQELKEKLGVTEPNLLRMGLRKLAEAEGLR